MHRLPRTACPDSLARGSVAIYPSNMSGLLLCVFRFGLLSSRSIDASFVGAALDASSRFGSGFWFGLHLDIFCLSFRFDRRQCWWATVRSKRRTSERVALLVSIPLFARLVVATASTSTPAAATSIVITSASSTTPTSSAASTSTARSAIAKRDRFG